MAKSLAIHVFVLAVVMVIPAQALFRSESPNKELDIVFYRPPEIAVNSRAVSRPMPRGTSEAGAPAPALKPKPTAPAGPDLAGKAELPPGPEVGPPVEAKSKVEKAGILALKDKIASLAQDTVVVPLGADARHIAADDVGRPSARSLLTSSTPGSSGGINVASLSRSVGGGGGGGGGGNGSGGGDGRVSMCVLQSTDMDAPDLATQVVGRVRTINFGAKDVPAVTIVYPIDFLPAA